MYEPRLRATTTVSTAGTTAVKSAAKAANTSSLVMQMLVLAWRTVRAMSTPGTTCEVFDSYAPSRGASDERTLRGTQAEAAMRTPRSPNAVEGQKPKNIGYRVQMLEEMAADLNNARDPIIRSQLLLISVGEEMQGIIKAADLQPPLDSPDCYQNFTSNIVDYLRALTDPASELDDFSRMEQEKSEKAISFLARIKEKAKLCGYSAENLDYHVRSQFLKGLANRDIVKDARRYKRSISEIVSAATNDEAYEGVEVPERWAFSRLRNTAAIAVIRLEMLSVTVNLLEAGIAAASGLGEETATANGLKTVTATANRFKPANEGANGLETGAATENGLKTRTARGSSLRKTPPNQRRVDLTRRPRSVSVMMTVDEDGVRSVLDASALPTGPEIVQRWTNCVFCATR
ncbi:hypothetical protein quinque_009233 [Culex quinquefasciatus]